MATRRRCAKLGDVVVRSAVFLALTVGLGCAGEEAVSPVDASVPSKLIDHGFWRVLDAEQDPFDDRPEGPLECPGLHRENLGGRDVLSIDTRFCDYVTARQPALRGAEAGQTLGIVLGYFSLVAPEPAEAHVAIAIGETVVWEERVPIPSDSGVLNVGIEAPFAIEAGTPIDFHLHNHGANEWFLATIEVRE